MKMSEENMTQLDKETTLLLLFATLLWFAVGWDLLMTALKPYELKQPCTTESVK